MPMLVHSEKKVDNIFFACCILHNWLLRFDELDSRWKEPENWLSANAVHTPEEVDRLRQFYGDAFQEQDYNYVGCPLRRSHIQVEDTFFSLREKLVSHVSFLRRQNALYWLQPANRSRRKYDAVVSAQLVQESRSVRPRLVEPVSAASNHEEPEDVSMLCAEELRL